MPQSNENIPSKEISCNLKTQSTDVLYFNMSITSFLYIAPFQDTWNKDSLLFHRLSKPATGTEGIFNFKPIELFQCNFDMFGVFCIMQKNRILNCWGEICKEWDYSLTNPNSDISFEMQCHDSKGLRCA